MTNAATFEDAFNLLCGEKLGSGIHREVFECRLRPDLVCKVEIHSGRDRIFANVLEAEYWNAHGGNPAIGKWLAPCGFLSPDGRILLQERAERIPVDYRLPEKLPIFLDDIKRSNFGLIDGKLVCIDYAWHRETPNTRLTRVKW